MPSMQGRRKFQMKASQRFPAVLQEKWLDTSARTRGGRIRAKLGILEEGDCVRRGQGHWPCDLRTSWDSCMMVHVALNLKSNSGWPWFPAHSSGLLTSFSIKSKLEIAPFWTARVNLHKCASLLLSKAAAAAIGEWKDSWKVLALVARWREVKVSMSYSTLALIFIQDFECLRRNAFRFEDNGSKSSNQKQMWEATFRECRMALPERACSLLKKKLLSWWFPSPLKKKILGTWFARDVQYALACKDTLQLFPATVAYKIYENTNKKYRSKQPGG